VILDVYQKLACREWDGHSCLRMMLSAVLSIHEMNSVPRLKDVVLLRA
jgi:hypothetical protein